MPAPRRQTPRHHAPRRQSAGFTLVELVIGITIMAIALLVMTGVLFPQAQRSTDPWFQVRSAELAQSFMNEILARSFDENSPRSGESYRCDDGGAGPACTNLGVCGGATPWIEEGASRELYDDVDDFHCFTATGDAITNISNQQLVGVYQSFTVSVDVQYAGTDLGLTAREAKRITVTVTPPRGPDVQYASYRTNY